MSLLFEARRAPWMRPTPVDARVGPREPLDPSDRVLHELRVLTDALYYVGSYDQVNVGGLVALEVQTDPVDPGGLPEPCPAVVGRGAALLRR